MMRSPLRALGCLLAFALLAGCFQDAMAASQPTLFSLTSGKPEVLAQGAQKSWPIQVNETNAFDAIFQGGMWLPNPAGGRIYAKYQRHILHANGIWTWVGSVETVHGKQPVVLTFGKGSVFGLIPQASGDPLRIVTRNGQTRVVETFGASMAHSAEELRLRSRPDFVVPPPVRKGDAGSHVTASIAAGAAVPAAASGPSVIDVMVAYTQGYVSEMGGVSQVQVRIQNLVDLTNQAYIASGINQQIRLVNTVQVNYPDNTSNQSALDDVTGLDSNGNPVPIPAGLQNIGPLRNKYGADLVALFRSFDNSTQGNCGVGWLIGSNQSQIIPTQSDVYGYSVVSDGSSGGYYCQDTTFAHELGHNMGSAHDRANAGGVSGAYSYSYGYLGTGTGGGFSTIMAYGTSADTQLSLFSNPNISTCLNSPCGVADSASNSADNAHSMNNTASLIAQFRASAAVTPGTAPVHNDFNGDRKSDILFTNPSTHQLVYWLMNGQNLIGWAGFTTSAQYQAIATGDFNGDGYTDVLWNAGGTLHMWLNDGKGGFVDKTFLAAPSSGWRVIGTGDINGSGEDAIFWYNPASNQLVYWFVNGASYLGYGSSSVTPGFIPGGVGDLSDDGFADVVWTDASNNLYVWIGDGSGGFTQYQSNGYISPGWKIGGIGDINGDGYADVVWTQPSTGGLEYFLMNGSQVVGYKIFYAGPAYTFAGVGDFDGDGKADILWTSGGNDLWMWRHSDPYNFRGFHVAGYPAGWSVSP